MPAHIPTPLRSGSLVAALALVALAAGCASPQESALNYDSSRENSHLDAQHQALGRGSQASPQIRLGFGSTGSAEAQATQAEAGQTADSAAVQAMPRPLAEARSFLGTVPCPSGQACEASRFVVTLAPSGEWRSRTTLLVGNEARHTLVDQGCWNIIGDEPLRIALSHVNEGTTKADLAFVNTNVLRVQAINGVQPMLEHRLTRQPDLDPIDELKARPALAC